MTSPVTSRFRSIAGIDPRMGQVVNDNTPPAFPGHELSDLDGLPRQPAAEAVAHYARLTQIASYPKHPDDAVEPVKTVPAMDALPEQTRRSLPTAKTRTVFAGVCSVLFHLAVFASLMTAAVTIPEDPVEEAGDTVSVIMLGDSAADQLASGEESKEPKPDEVVAETVQPDVVQPTAVEKAEVTPVEPQPSETPPADAAQPVQPAEALPETVQPDQVQPMSAVTQVSPETAVSPEPEVLAAQVPAEPSVAQPMASEIQPEEMKPAEAQPDDATPTVTQPETLQPAEPTDVAAAPPSPAETVTPIEKPKPPAKPVEKPKDVVKQQPPKPVRVKSGSQGEGEQNSRKGSSEGTETARSDSNSVSAGSRTGSGSAAVANYPGKVGARIRRSIRVPAQYRSMTQSTTVLVRLTIGSAGQLSSLSLVRSSGLSDLDNAVMDGIRRAAPFPPLPPEWGRPSWSFTQPLQVTGN